MSLSNSDLEQLHVLLASLQPEERELVEQLLAEEANGSTDLLKEVFQSIYENSVPPLDEFIYSKDYLGLPKGSVFPAIETLLWEMDKDDVREAFICAGKGSGKTAISSIVMARQSHKLVRCYRDPSAHFRLMPDSLIAVVNMSISAEQAEMVMFNRYWALLQNAKCFHDEQGKAVFKKWKRHIELPKNVHALSGHSGYKAYFGYDVFCGVLDECSWFKDKEDRPVSEEIYQGIKASCETRFPGAYKLICISSPQAQDDFLMKRIAEGKNMGRPIVVGETEGDSYAKITK